jgi:hypothetical protein
VRAYTDKTIIEYRCSSVADLNPDPHVFGPPGSGSISQRYGCGSGSGSGTFYYHGKNNQKNLDSHYFVTLFDFLSFKNDANVPSKSNKQKKCLRNKFFVAILKVIDENSRIRIHLSEAWIRGSGSGSTPKCLPQHCLKDHG